MTFAICQACIRVAPEWADSDGKVLRTTCIKCGEKLTTGLERTIYQPRPAPLPSPPVIPTVMIQEPPVSTVINPGYYKGREVMDIINRYKLSFCVGTIVCYLLRHMEKNGVEDLKKALWYLKEEIRIWEEGKDFKGNIKEEGVNSR